MPGSQDVQRDDTVTFLPHRLNRQPVVVRGLTADELWVCAGLSAAVGLVLGIPLAWFTSTLALVPTLIVMSVAVGVFAGGGTLRRRKRGRPDVWLYRQIQWWIALHRPSLAPYTGGTSLVTRSGYWTTRTVAP
jgi:conjugative transfer region protein (TIGR03750 family)